MNKRFFRAGGIVAAFASALVIVPTLLAGTSETVPSASTSFLFTVCANSICRSVGGQCMCLSGHPGITCTTPGTGCNIAVPKCEDDGVPAGACP
jgi:hypothetical protein